MNKFVFIFIIFVSRFLVMIGYRVVVECIVVVWVFCG